MNLYEEILKEIYDAIASDDYVEVERAIKELIAYAEARGYNEACKINKPE